MELLEEELTQNVIGAAMEVHRVLGCGFLEGVCQEALEIELTERGIPFSRQPAIEIEYKHHTLSKTYQPDLLIEKRLVVELKALDRIGAVEESQLLNYLKATGIQVGLLMNFGRRSLEWKRMVF
ncbi:MAG TPA: GxxExxY protein [Verrucomicrobiae bacterium]|nr:GxxExxY protein [Verrucomicrobiae bacterium]